MTDQHSKPTAPALDGIPDHALDKVAANPVPTIHPRQQATNDASYELAVALRGIAQRHALTPSEVFAILGEAVSRWAGRCLATERRRTP